MPLDDFAAVLNEVPGTVVPAAAAAAVYDWEAANQRKKDAVQQLAPLAEALDDIEALIDELVARTRGLELG